ncbi:MAG: SprT-like domain-containing protein [Sulfuricaulis sp.]
MTDSLESLLHTTFEMSFRRAEIYFQRRFERPHLALNLRGMAAAVAYPTNNAVRINRRLLEQNVEDFLLNTVPHEVSHLIVYHMHGRYAAPHGTEWASIMREVFELKPVRCHGYNVQPNMSVAYRYLCGCATGHSFSTRRHNSAQRGRRYYCRRCRQSLTFSHRENPSNVKHAPARTSAEN